MSGYTKRAIIRDPNAPPFTPARLHLNCECGQQVDMTRRADLTACTCGIWYDNRGWIIQRPQPQAAARATIDYLNQTA